MKIKSIKSIITIVLLTTFVSHSQKKILWIGNSYTGSNNLPSITDQLANSLGDDIEYQSSTPGGANFNNHSNNQATYQKINSKEWDVVILQDQSQEPSFPHQQVTQNTYPYAKQICDSIYAKNSCTEVMFYMTWGRKNGDSQWDSISTFDKMNKRLKNAYITMANDNNASVSPVGVAWKYVIDNYSDIELFSADGSHPSYAGSYLAACVFYANVFRQKTKGASFRGNLSEDVATKLQKVADLICFDDNFKQWRNGAKNLAFFSAEQIGNSIVVNDKSIGENLTYSWNFGNGNTSTESNPDGVVFSSTDEYPIVLVTSNSCNVDTFELEVKFVLAIDDLKEIKAQFFSKNKELNILFKNNHFYDVYLLDLSGKVIHHKKTKNKVSFRVNNEGVYLLKVYSKLGVLTKKVKL